MSNFKELKSYQTGDMVIHYWIDEKNIVGMSINPSKIDHETASRRINLNDEHTVKPLHDVFKVDFPACTLENLVQIKIVGDIHPTGFSGGTSMRNSASTEDLKFKNQNLSIAGEKHTITTELEDRRGISAFHYLCYWPNRPFIEVFTEIVNGSRSTISLEMVSSFSLGGISPFQQDEAIGKYNLHRFSSTWSAEGRHESLPIESLNLEKSWNGHGVRSLRFGQIGSMPVKHYFPFAALEDKQYEVFWGAQIAHPGSWQLEVYRKTDMLNMSGGLADREFGHWKKDLQPGSSLETPKAILSCCLGDIQNLTERMVRYQEFIHPPRPESEEDLPIIFNDWCTTWGYPSEKNILKLADRLENSEVKYLVMDDGWFNDRPGVQQGLGDWQISETIYPNGFANLCDTLREKGFTPGVWFELECCTEGSLMFDNTEHLIHRDGKVLQYGTRRFLDFRDPWVHEYLYEKVILMLKENKILYIKTDYNDSIGLGCDSPDSLGEGLREHLSAVQDFYRRMRLEIPELVVEICSSGGHRLEPSWMALSSMGGFSDSHEGLDIPIIAANTQMMIPARQNQVWAVLREEDSLSRLHYSLSATFFGRMCLSGDIHELNKPQMDTVKKAMKMYQDVKGAIREGFSRRYGTTLLSYTHPTGYQAIVRTNDKKDEAFVVVHSFRNSPSAVSVPLEAENWEIAGFYMEKHLSVSADKNALFISGLKDFNGLIVSLKSKNHV
ncbi:glycoside hydrolase family 36 protein [Oceanispirochaeta sp. M1]|uniref:glycoside hydrolase family 36 protein n=1 Tax=Oceanispirochaeta sp. M1 TaxID=2283433 RepID=UPI000E09177F|nr:glycoside hydrolase family 36 protein [Oceanispirochaeta sp. M1]NPD74159.1 alpha-galactosidase [Oceanispirochaeta sp. M1]RDG29973.1 alpha-galactosidase [Oceanispirochaeta sp. M1]